MRHSRFFLVGVAVVLVVAVLGCDRSTPPGAASTGVRIAMNLPLTGPFGVYGQSVRDGAMMATDELAGKGPTLTLDIEDNAGSTDTAITVFQKQSLDHVDIYASGVKPQTMAIFDRAKVAGFPYFVWVFDAFIVERNPSVFRTWVNYKYEPQKYIQYAQARHAKRIAIACVNLPHTTEELNQVVIPALKNAGIETAIEIYELESRQHRDVILKLSRNKPDLYILNGFQEDLVAFTRALRDLRLFSDGNVIGTYDLLDAAKILGPGELDGFRVVAPEFVVHETPVYRQWKQRFTDRFKRQPLYTDAYSYDMISVVSDTARRLKLPATSAQWIETLKQSSLDGVTGHLQFDAGRDLRPNLRVGVYRNGTLVLDPSEEVR